MREPSTAVRKSISWEHDIRGKKAIMRSRKKMLTVDAQKYPEDFISPLPPYGEYCMLSGFSVVTIVDQLDDDTIVFTVSDSADAVEVTTSISQLYRVLCDDEGIPTRIPYKGEFGDYLLRIL